MIRIGFSGVPGSGKTTCARALAAYCRNFPRLKNIELVSEYARRYITKYGIDSLWDQIRLVNKQVDWENSLSDKIDIVITDSPIFLGFVYAMELRKDSSNEKETMLMNDLFKILNKHNCPPRYDIIFHFPPILKAVEDGVRPKSNFDEKWRTETNDKLINCFKIFPPKVFRVVNIDTTPQRVDFCEQLIQAYMDGEPMKTFV